MTNPLSPIARYEQDLRCGGFQRDEAQIVAVDKLMDLYHRLQELNQNKPDSGVAGWLKGLLGGKVTKRPPKGLYLWGGVGRGKTYLMDIFYESLVGEKKMRTHFHRFMRRVHHELTQLGEQKNPLEKVADILASETDVICFDEFFVSDITDAMILANLLEALFARGICLVTTSNIMPDGLYQNGLQRQRFLPAIALLNEHLEVVNVDGGIDYRLRALTQAALYHFPVGDMSNSALLRCFESLMPDAGFERENVNITIEGRGIVCFKEAEDVAWFRFAALCDGPRSQNDYIVLAKEYHAVILSDVPKMGVGNDDQARRFVYLVDEFYDRNVKLVISAEVDINELYGTGRLEFEFQRTVSRLLEMQSEDYLARPHKP